MVVEQQPPWAPHLRSRSRLRSFPKRHFTDPSLAAAALNAGPENLMKDIPWFGLLFESLVVRDLRVYAQAMGGRVCTTIVTTRASKSTRSWTPVPTDGPRSR